MTAATLTWLGGRNRVEAIWLLPVAILALTLFLLAEGLGLFFGLSPRSMLALYGFFSLRILPVLLICTLAYQAVLSARENPASPLTALIARVRALWADKWLLTARVAPLLLMPLVFVGFSSLKMLMPRFVPFYLDDSFAAIDRILFFGYQPWQLTHYLFGSVEVTRALDFLYSLWVVILSVAICAFALFAPRPDRARFFMSFTLAWFLLGFIGAWLLASAGPCYSAFVGASSAPEFKGLMDRLAAMAGSTGRPLNAVGWQAMLWQSHSSEFYSFGMGISAMPSLHNAISVLYALAAFRVGRLVGWTVSGFAVIIFVGSVHLGWHYAVDGIVGAGAMYLIWRWVDRWCRRSGYDEAVERSALNGVPVQV